jgi:hypothetical protein
MPRILFAPIAAFSAATLLGSCASSKPPAVPARLAEPVRAADPCAKYRSPTTFARCRLFSGADGWRFIPEAGRGADLDIQLRCAALRPNPEGYERCIGSRSSSSSVAARAPTAARVSALLGAPRVSALPDVEPSAGPVRRSGGHPPQLPSLKPWPSRAASQKAQAAAPAPKQVTREPSEAAQSKTEPEFRDRLAEIEGRVYDLVHDQLNAFLAGPWGDCSSNGLEDPAGSAMLWGFATDDLSGRQQGAGWVLDVADGAADHSCPDLARKLYRHVIEAYIGWGYAAHRQRAEIGLADLRG